MPNELSGEALDARFFEVCGYRKEFWDTTYNHQRGQEIVYVPVEAPPRSEWRERDNWWHRVCYAMRDWRGGKVSTDANACEAWAMRWAREQGLSWRLDQSGRRNECRAEVFGAYQGREVAVHAYGKDFKEAFVRACVAAEEILKQSKGGA